MLIFQGKLVDENGKYLIGAPICIKLEDTNIINTKEENCTNTDVDGSFILSKIPPNSYVIVFYIGYLPRVVHVNDAGLIKIEPNLKILEKVIRICC